MLMLEEWTNNMTNKFNMQRMVQAEKISDVPNDSLVQTSPFHPYQSAWNSKLYVCFPSEK